MRSKPGPKPKPKAQRQTERVEVKFTVEERRRVEDAAAAADQPTATWIHDLVIAYLTER